MFDSTRWRKSDSSLRLPAHKRISAPNSERLTTITEGGGSDAPPPIPRRSSRRNSATNSLLNSERNSRRWSHDTQNTPRVAPPPPYEWIPEPIDGADNDESAVVDERLEKLRRGESTEETRRRGGWRRLAIIIGIVFLIIIALAVGLGVGLTRKKSNGNNEPNGSSGSNPPPQKFPLGEYSMITALHEVETSCTTNPATWRCYPYVLYATDGSTNSSSLASFNWIIRSTSSTYATNTTSTTTSAQGIPANLTVSTQNDPFGITFKDKPLTYVSPAGNGTATRYTFSFTMPKLVIPSPAITSDNSATECYFNQTVFTGNLYLSAPRTFPPKDVADSTTLAGYEQWPYAVEITQTAAGGTNVPNCYKTVDGHAGARITDGLDPLPASAECLCDYRNF